MAVVHAKTLEGLRTQISTRDQTWYADEPLEDGGTNTAPTPMELLRGALGSCIAITVMMYAQRKQWPLLGVEVDIDSERFNAGDYPAYQGDAQFVHEIRERVILHGPDLTDDQRARLMDVATKCPVRRLIANPTFFTELEPAGEG